MHKRAKNKERRVRGIKFYALYSLLYALCFMLYAIPVGFSDMLRLKEIPEGENGNEVEIMEERDDSFIVKIPKKEIEMIKRKRPTEMKLWKEKRILWEDAGDYVTLYLPKEKIVLPEKYEGDEYNSAKALEKELNSMAVKGKPSGTNLWKSTGRVIGRVLKDGLPLARVKLKIVNVSYQNSLVSRLFGPKESRPEDLVLETISDESGDYEFRDVPIGEYDIYWSREGADSWYRRISEKPSVTVRPGETVKYPDIELK